MLSFSFWYWDQQYTIPLLNKSGSNTEPTMCIVQRVTNILQHSCKEINRPYYSISSWQVHASLSIYTNKNNHCRLPAWNMDNILPHPSCLNIQVAERFSTYANVPLQSQCHRLLMTPLTPLRYKTAPNLPPDEKNKTF